MSPLLSGRLLKIDGYMLRGVWQALVLCPLVRNNENGLATQRLKQVALLSQRGRAMIGVCR